MSGLEAYGLPEANLLCPMVLLSSEDGLAGLVDIGEPEACLCAEGLERGVEERAYRGGVMYCWPGVQGAAEGFKPSRARWEGVRGMSCISSLVRKSGAQAMAMLSRSSERQAQMVY